MNLKSIDNNLLTLSYPAYKRTTNKSAYTYINFCPKLSLLSKQEWTSSHFQIHVFTVGLDKKIDFYSKIVSKLQKIHYMWGNRVQKQVILFPFHTNSVFFCVENCNLNSFD